MQLIPVRVTRKYRDVYTGKSLVLTQILAGTDAYCETTAPRVLVFALVDFNTLTGIDPFAPLDLLLFL